MHRFIRTSKTPELGSGLVSALGIMAIIGMVGMLITSQLRNSDTLTRFQQESLQHRILKNKLALSVSSSQACEKSLSDLKPKNPKPQPIVLRDSAGGELVRKGQRKNNLLVKSVIARSTPIKNKWFEYRVKITVAADRSGPLATRFTESLSIHAIYNDKGALVGCISHLNPFQLQDVVHKSVDVGLNTTLYHSWLEPKRDAGKWIHGLDTNACYNLAGQKIKKCTSIQIPGKTKIIAKGNRLTFDISALLQAYGPGQGTKLVGEIRNGLDKVVSSRVVHSVQADKKLTALASSRGSTMQWNIDVRPGGTYYLSFKLIGFRYENLDRAISPTSPRLYDPGCGGRYYGHMPGTYINAWRCPIESRVWGIEFVYEDHLVYQGGDNA